MSKEDKVVDVYVFTPNDGSEPAVYITLVSGGVCVVDKAGYITTHGKRSKTINFSGHMERLGYKIYQSIFNSVLEIAAEVSDDDSSDE